MTLQAQPGRTVRVHFLAPARPRLWLALASLRDQRAARGMGRDEVGDQSCSQSVQDAAAGVGILKKCRKFQELQDKKENANRNYTDAVHRRLYKNDSSGAAPDGLSDCPRPLFSPGSPSPLAHARAAAGSALLCTLHYICNFNNGVRPPHHDARARIPPAPASRRARIPLRLLEARARLTRQRRDWSRRQGVGAAPRTSAADSAAAFSSLFRNSLMSCSRPVRPPARNGKGPTGCPGGPADLAEVPRASMAYAGSTWRRGVGRHPAAGSAPAGCACRRRTEEGAHHDLPRWTLATSRLSDAATIAASLSAGKTSVLPSTPLARRRPRARANARERGEGSREDKLRSPPHAVDALVNVSTCPALWRFRASAARQAGQFCWIKYEVLQERPIGPLWARWSRRDGAPAHGRCAEDTHPRPAV